MGRLWDLIEEHREAQQYPPSYRQLAIRLGVSQSLFDTWKRPKKLPARENLEAIAKLVGVPYQTALEAALDDTRYRIPPSRDARAAARDDAAPDEDDPSEVDPGEVDPGEDDPAPSATEISGWAAGRTDRTADQRDRLENAGEHSQVRRPDDTA